MKKLFPAAILLILITLPSFLFAAEENEQSDNSERMQVTMTEDSLVMDDTAYPKPTVTVLGGPAATALTRIIKQTGRSNFVYEDTMIGAFIEVKSENFQPVNHIFRLAAYYPVHYTFNKVPQNSVQTLLYSFDIMYAPCIEADMWKLFHINFAPGIHMNYELTDSYRYISAGAGMLLGAQLPVTKTITLFADGIATADYGNFGSNKDIAPIDYQWQYQLQVGIRYTKRIKNQYSYLH